VVPPEQSADLRDYYNKHTKTDRLDSRLLARLPLLHPEGLREIDDLGPAEALRRAVRHRSAIPARGPCSAWTCRPAFRHCQLRVERPHDAHFGGYVLGQLPA
jgi:hypothetical protein